MGKPMPEPQPYYTSMFIQITFSPAGNLYALDNQGQIWRREVRDAAGDAIWRRQVLTRETHNG